MSEKISTPDPTVSIVLPTLAKYKMSNKKRGLLVIINNEKFKGALKLNDRTGTNKDAGELMATFAELGFDILLKNNLTKEEIMKTMSSVATDDHSNSDCLGIAILTHGGIENKRKAVLYGSDCVSFELDALVKPLKKESKENTIIDKPKFIIIQSCPGINDETVESDIALPIPLGKDFLFYYSIAFGWNAWRKNTEGSVFIQALCEVIKEHKYQDLGLTDLFTRANTLVDEEYDEMIQPGQENDGQGYRIPEINSQLRNCVKINTEGRNRRDRGFFDNPDKFDCQVEGPVEGPVNYASFGEETVDGPDGPYFCDKSKSGGFKNRFFKVKIV